MRDQLLFEQYGGRIAFENPDGRRKWRRVGDMRSESYAVPAVESLRAAISALSRKICWVKTFSLSRE
jgi:hypothetical protein